MSEEQVKIRFFTREDDESLHVLDAPLYVPVSLKRYGLSEVVNHLLDKESPVPFDFLIDGVLLRSSVSDYLVKNGLSSETFLQVEYTRAVLPPAFLASFNNEDWVSCVDTITSQSAAAKAGRLTVSPQILAGSYDGVVRTYNQLGKVEKQYVGHSAAVKAVKWVYAHRIVSAGNDQQIRLWRTEANKDDDLEETDDEPENAKTIAIFDAHTAPVVDLDVDVRLHRILSAGSDGVVGFWLTVPKDMNVVENETGLKRRKTDAAAVHRAPLSLLESHTQPVEGVIFDAQDQTVGYSVSQDHTIKTWDLVTARCVDTRATGFSLLSVVQLPGLNLLASGSSARHINLHDPRTAVGQTERSVTKLTGHTNFVVDLAACPTNQAMFALASHDGTVKVWDVRSDKALHTITRDLGEGKVFGVAWDREIGIVSGGEDKKVQINLGDSIARIQ